MGEYNQTDIETQIKGHQTAALAFLELAESECYRLEIKAETVETIYTLSVPVKQDKANDIARQFFYDMSAYHTKQKLRWELIKSGCDPDAIISSQKKS